MNLWDKYQALSPLPRIEVTFGITFLVVCIIIWMGRRLKENERAAISQMQLNNGQINNSRIEQKNDGVFYIYIAWWRYLVLEMAFALMLYVLVTGISSIYQDLPKDYFHHWNKDATLVLAGAAGILMMAAFLIKLLVRSYKDVQMEIGNDYVRFRVPAVRGGILLSDNYVTLTYAEIQEIDFRQASPLTGYILSLKTTTKTYNINLLLTSAEKIASYRILEQAASDWQKRNGKNLNAAR